MIDLAQLAIGPLLGRGGQGQVWLATERRGGRRLAVKLLRVSADPAARARLETRLRKFEGDLALGGLLPVLDHHWLSEVPEPFRDAVTGGRGGEGLVLILPFVEGESLAQLLLRGPLRAGQVAAVVAEVASALARLHADGTAHGNVTLANLLALKTGQVTLTDPHLFAAPPPQPADDLRALGQLGLEAWEPGGLPPPPEPTAGSAERHAHRQLQTLLTDLRDGAALAAEAVASQASKLAHALGANEKAPLAGLVQVREPSLPTAEPEAPRPIPPRHLRRPLPRIWLVGISAVAALALAEGGYLHFIAHASLDSTSPHATTSDLAYDFGCQTHHTGPLHQLAPDESADCERGYVRIDVPHAVNGIAILDEAGTTLWEQASPPLRSFYRFDLPLGRYTFLELHDPAKPGYRDPLPFELTKPESIYRNLTSSVPLRASRKPWVTEHRKD